MIVTDATAESQINDVLEQLPTIESRQPVYQWGDAIHLTKWIVKKQNAGENTYPLIYQTSKGDKLKTVGDTFKVDWEAILAVQNTNEELVNDERWALSFRNHLNPLAKYIITGFEYAGFIVIDNNWSLDRHGLHGTEQNFTVDIWDAAVMRCSLLIHNHPVRTLYID